jgi:hypothetical protein
MTSPSAEYRHRLPQERRTPEAYGRSNPRLQHQHGRRSTSEVVPTQLEYEDVYNTSYNTTGFSEELANYARNSVSSPEDIRRASRSRPKSDYIPSSHGLPIQDGVQQSAAAGHNTDRVPRPHSADFLEYERNNSLVSASAATSPEQLQSQGKSREGGNHRRHSQPPRPKSSIGEIR